MTAVVAALVLAGAEAAVRHLDPHLPPPREWADQATAVKARQLDRLAGHRCTDVVFAGNSMARDAFDPGPFTVAAGGATAHDVTAYNAALDAAGPEQLRAWLGDHVLPATRPATVVVGLASFDLNDRARIPAAALDAYRDAPRSGSGVTGRVEAWSVANVAAVRHRAALRSPLEVARATQRWWSGERTERPSASGIPGVLAADGHGLSRRDQQHRPGSAAASFVERELLNDFELGGRQVDQLRRLVADVRATGSEVALVALPVTGEYVALHPGADRDQAAFRAALDDLGRSEGVAVVDAADPGPTGFADTHHVNGAGATVVSEALPGRLRAAGVGLGPC